MKSKFLVVASLAFMASAFSSCSKTSVTSSDSKAVIANPGFGYKYKLTDNDATNVYNLLYFAKLPHKVINGEYWLHADKMDCYYEVGVPPRSICYIYEGTTSPMITYLSIPTSSATQDDLLRLNLLKDAVTSLGKALPQRPTFISANARNIYCQFRVPSGSVCWAQEIIKL